MSDLNPRFTRITEHRERQAERFTWEIGIHPYTLAKGKANSKKEAQHFIDQVKIKNPEIWK